MANDITQSEWEELIATDTDAVILDVRTEDEVAEGYIPNMINIDVRGGHDFIEAVDKLDKAKNYYVYCRSGMRSAQACELMRTLGFKTTYNLLGGIIEWDGEIAE